MGKLTSAAADAVILIPSLEPDERLPAYIQRLSESGFQHIVVVDDGSSAEYQPIFQRLETVRGTVVLHHEVNGGGLPAAGGTPEGRGTRPVPGQPGLQRGPRAGQEPDREPGDQRAFSAALRQMPCMKLRTITFPG